MKKRKINMYSTFTELKASIVERFNRTIKNWMWTEFSFQGNRKWVNLIPTLLHRYNNRVHRSTGMKPEEVKKENEAVILRRLSANLAKHPERTPRFAINDRVRISRIRDPLMSKGYLPAWTNEQFICRIKLHVTSQPWRLFESENSVDPLHLETMLDPLYQVRMVISEHCR
ncbi:unnamed protein product [Nesidiocoris tenuis]|uniref:Integrase catalytic domain-containing protein n=1 Tax=Nesidiocoris tenuis TaxID=355587 RepID=A0A6H5HC37_9HEMI|nr:unnamed protein product [Nesidiocoris tenuis]